MQHRDLTFTTRDNLQLYAQVWQPLGEERAVLVIIHGGFEHSGRYLHVASYFTQRGFIVYACDLRGHGRSQGHRGYINDFDNVLVDIDTFLSLVRKDFPHKPLFILGHSAGGLVTVAYMLSRPDTAVAGVILSAPALRMHNVDNPLTNMTVHFLGLIVPRLKIPLLDARFLSHDKKVVAAYKNDPLIPHEGVCACVLSELLYAMNDARKKLSQIRFPVLVLHGTEDRFADIRGSKLLYEKAGSSDKTIRVYGGLYHEILNEPEKKSILGEIFEWIDKRLHA